MTHTAKSGVDESAEVHLPQRNKEARVDRQQQEKIQLARADEFREVGAVVRKNA